MAMQDAPNSLIMIAPENRFLCGGSYQVSAEAQHTAALALLADAPGAHADQIAQCHHAYDLLRRAVENWSDADIRHGHFVGELSGKIVAIGRYQIFGRR